MSAWSARGRKLSWLAPAILLLLLVVLGCAPDSYPQSTLSPKGEFARMVDDVFMTTVRWAAIVFVLVEAALIVAIFKFRAKPNDAEPKQVHGNATAEIIWTAVPALILAVIAVPTVRTIFRTYEVPGENPLVVEVVGHQWWWEFKYPEYGVTTANELHVPMGRTVSLKMTTNDVLHSFWVPQFAAKRDVFPNRNTPLWVRAEVAGDYPGQCAEFCGIEHGRMGFRVIAQSDADFQAYIATLVASGAPAPGAPDSAKTTAAGGLKVTTLASTMRVGDTADVAPAPGLAPVDPLVAEGEKLFLTKGCVGCHSFNATKPMGIGPNLSNIGVRTYIAAGQFPNTDENLARWIRDPQGLKPGVLMPNLNVTEPESKALVAYLRTHK